MSTQRCLSITLSVLVVLGGLWFAILADESPAPGPVVSVPPDCNSPGTVSGIATDPAEQDVTVIATLEPDGTPLEGSPDDTMEDGSNEFSFEVPAGQEGKRIMIVAVTEDGRETVKYVNIN